MEINYLREFVVLADTGNFMEAADLLYSSQSSLSKHIKSIEVELGAPLFERTTRKVRISKFGELFLPYARQIVELQDQYTSVLHSSLESDQDTLTLGSIPALAPYNVTNIFVQFKKSRPHSTLNVVQTFSEDLKEMLRQKKCDLAFIRFTVGEQEETEDLVKLPYAADSLVAVLPVTHALAREKTISLRMLARENFLLIGENTMLYRLSVRACEQSGFTPNVTYADHRLENLIELVAKGMGVSLLMKPLALYHGNPNVAVVDLSPAVCTEVCLCYLKNAKLSEAAHHFMVCTEMQRSKN